MSEPRLDLAVVDDVARIRLSRPDAANAIDLAFAQEFEAAAEACATAMVRAVLISAEGRQFCVGGDLKSFVEQPDLGAHLALVTGHLYRGIATLVEGDAPVIVAVNGAAAGAGLGIICAADVVVAGESATFLMAYTKLGLTPDGSSTWFLPQLVGLRRALDMSLTNRVLNAEEALSWGVVSRVVPDSDVGVAAESIVETLRVGPTGAYGATARLLRSAASSSLRRQLDAESASISERARTNDGREGIRAFLERRAGDFDGR